MNELLEAVGAQAGDFILFCADGLETVRRTLGGLRGDIAKMLGMIEEGVYDFSFITDFPQFEYSEADGRYMAMHHPFTMPYEEDISYLLSEPERVRAQAYDVVLNGVELGSGSLRIYDSEIQRKMFEALGFSEGEVEERFGFMVNAFSYGTPPHGGFAFGLDRLVMLMVGAASLRDIIVFPKTKDATCLLTGAPGPVSVEQLEELYLSHGSADAAHGKRLSEQENQQWRAIDVARVAELANLRLTGQEQEKMERELSAIVTFADALASAETEGVPITAHVLPMENVLRDDRCAASFQREQMLANAPEAKDGFIYVPKVLDQPEEV